MTDLTQFLQASLLVSLRIVPTLAFAPPFTLMRIPALVRLIVAMALSATMVSAFPGQTTGRVGDAELIALATTELSIGIGLALALQLAFAALMTAGRTIDLQAGYAYSLLADPSGRGQLPLIGTIFAYAMAAIFFAAGGADDLLAIWAASLQQLPVGSFLGTNALPNMITYLGGCFLIAFAAGGLILLVLFLIDLAIAFMSRTLPQMNVLFLSFQVKTIATLILLPLALASSASLFLRLVRFALDSSLELV